MPVRLKKRFVRIRDRVADNADQHRRKPVVSSSRIYFIIVSRAEEARQTGRLDIPTFIAWITISSFVATVVAFVHGGHLQDAISYSHQVHVYENLVLHGCLWHKDMYR